jgi:hypothetical protein
MVSRFLPSSQISGRMYSTVVSLSVWCEKRVAAWHYSVIGNQLLFANNRNRVRGVVLCLSQGGACSNLSENFREYGLKRDPSNDTTDNPPLFSLVNTFKWCSSQLSCRRGARYVWSVQYLMVACKGGPYRLPGRVCSAASYCHYMCLTTVHVLK